MYQKMLVALNRDRDLLARFMGLTGAALNQIDDSVPLRHQPANVLLGTLRAYITEYHRESDAPDELVVDAYCAAIIKRRIGPSYPSFHGVLDAIIEDGMTHEAREKARLARINDDA